MVDHLFTTTKLEKLFARWYTANGASGRVLEKAGYTHEGSARAYLKINGAWEDHVIYGLTEESALSRGMLDGNRP